MPRLLSPYDSPATSVTSRGTMHDTTELAVRLVRSNVTVMQLPDHLDDDPVRSLSAPGYNPASVSTCAPEACVSLTPKPPQSPYRRATPPPYHYMSNLSSSSSSSTRSEWSDNGEDGEDGSSNGPLPPHSHIYPNAQPHPALASHKIFVGGLHPNVDKLILRKHFEVRLNA